MISQLSLFDTADVIKPTYKVGDRVKLRKKPMAASYVKRGDIVEIAAVHPTNGSVKFWNERSERWEFIHPDEIGVTSPNVQTADTEYTVALGDKDDSVSNNVQTADTEYTVALGDKDDSVSKAISIYRPRGTARSGEYFRFSYRDGLQMRHIHIRGGNTDSPIAQAKVAEVRSLLASGVSPAEIALLLKKPIC